MTDFDRFRVLWPDHLGLARGKYLPARSAGRGTSFCVGVYQQGYDKVINMVDVGIDPTGFPDLDATFDLADARPGWEPGTGVVVADLSFHDEPYPASSRHALRRAVEAWEERGFQVNIGIELEAYLFEPDEAGGWRPLDTPNTYVYGTGPMADPTGVIDEIMMTADACGFLVEAINSEFDTPQFELTLEYAPALESVDNIFLFKELAREIAYEHGLLLSFLGRPLPGRAGSGMHINFSLTAADGSNAFWSPDRHDQLSTLARQCIAGILKHHEGLTALMAPTVNAYKRLVPGELVGQWANWGYDHRCTAVRIPPHREAATRIEHRMADGAASPYTAVAALLQAALLGVVGRLTCPSPETGDGMDEINTERRCPSNLDAACDALVADEALVEAVGSSLVANFVAHKRIEWQNYVAAHPDWEQQQDVFTDYERDTYLRFL